MMKSGASFQIQTDKHYLIDICSVIHLFLAAVNGLLFQNSITYFKIIIKSEIILINFLPWLLSKRY